MISDKRSKTSVTNVSQPGFDFNFDSLNDTISSFSSLSSYTETSHIPIQSESSPWTSKPSLSLPSSEPWLGSQPGSNERQLPGTAKFQKIEFVRGL